MDKSDFVIIGGVACGPKTAATLARRLPGTSITLFQKEERLSYGTCGLPYFASGDINSFDELTYTPYGIPRDRDFFKKSKGFDVITNAEVVSIDRENKKVTVQNQNIWDEDSGKGPALLHGVSVPAVDTTRKTQSGYP